MKKKIQILGQRCSGTNYLEQLLLSNFTNVEISNYYGSKHVWNAKLQREIQPSDDIHIVIIVRNPYNWIRSIYKQPHHCPQLLGLSFREFVTSKWTAYDKAGWNSLDPNLRLDRLHRAPIIESFEHVIELRNQKNQLFQSILKMHPDKTILINYENIYNDIEKELSKVAGLFKLKKRESDFKQYESYKKSTKKFKPKKLVRIPESVKDIVDKKLNWEIENHFAYRKSDYRYDKYFNIFRIQFKIAVLMVKLKLMKNNVRQNLREIRIEDDRRFLKMQRTKYFSSELDKNEKKDLLNEVLNIKPNESWALIEMSKILKESCHYSESVEILNKILDKNPDHKMALFLSGANERLLGNQDRAVIYFKRCADLNPLWKAPLKQLLSIYRKNGQLDEVKKLDALISGISMKNE